jgi:FkbM family methyltransferase
MGALKMKMRISEASKKKFIKIRQTFFPTEHDRNLQKWYSSGADEDLRYDYDLDQNSLVFDLGGYRGQWASDIFSRYCCRVLIFEPIESFYIKIKKRFYKNAKIEPFCLALGAYRRKEVFSLCEDGTSLFKETSVKETVQFEDVVDFFNEHKIDNVDLMKINIEGGEYELLPRLIDSGLIKRIKNLQIQFHRIDKNSEKDMALIRTELSKTHTCVYHYKFLWESWKIC